MVGDARLRVVVGTDLFGAVAGGDEGLAFGRHLLHILIIFAFVEACAEDDDSLFEVFDLGLLVLAADDDAGGDMGKTDGRIGGVDTLSARAGGAESVLADIGHIKFDIKFLGLGEYDDSSGRGMDTALRLGGRDTLDTMDTRLILERAIDLVAGEVEGDILISAGGALVEIDDVEFPMSLFGIACIHTEEVAGEEAGLIAAGAAAYLNDSVLIVGRVGRDEQDADILFHLIFEGGRFEEFGLGHLAEFLILFGGEERLTFGNAVEECLIVVVGLDDRLEVLIVLADFDKAFDIRGDKRIVHLLFDL